MPFGPAYTRSKTFIAGGTLLPGDLNSIQDDLGIQIEKNAPEDVVTALPTVGLVDGQIARYQDAAMAADGIVWTFRYRQGSASPFKWEFVGGPKWIKHDTLAPASVFANVSDPNYNSGFYSSGGNPPAPWNITAPLQGDYVVIHGVNQHSHDQSLPRYSIQSFAINNAGEGSTMRRIIFEHTTLNLYSSGHLEVPTLAIPAGAVIELRHCRHGGLSDYIPFWQGRYIGLLPVRVI